MRFALSSRAVHTALRKNLVGGMSLDDPRIQAAFNGYVRALRSEVDARISVAAAELVATIPWDEVSAALRAEMSAALLALANDSIRRADGIGFLVNNQHAISWAAEHSAELVTLIDAQTRDALRSYVSSAIELGIPPRELGREIRSLVGINAPQAAQLSRLTAAWLGDGLSTWEIERLIAAQTERMIAYRSLMIARTETTTAQARGLQAGWSAASDMGIMSRFAVQEWIATNDLRCCDDCRALHGRVVPMGHAFPGGVTSPALHPNCRCTLGMRTLTPDDFAREAASGGWRFTP